MRQGRYTVLDTLSVDEFIKEYDSFILNIEQFFQNKININ